MRYIITILAAVLIFYSCNDSFLDEIKPDEVSTASYWTSENDLTSWINTIYELATSPYNHYTPTKGSNWSNILYGKAVNRAYNSRAWVVHYRDVWGGDCATMSSAMSNHNLVRNGHNFAPTGEWDTQQAGGWWWLLIRPINLFLENYQHADLDSETLEEYGGQGYLWRAWFYYDKVMHYGDVPLVTTELSVADTAILFGERDPRATVMAQVLEDINYACEYMPDTYNNGDPGYMDRWSAYALKSRICLFEGTWQKYHGGTDDAEKWLQEAADAAKYLMENGGFALYNTGNPETDYRFPYYQEDLSDNPEIIYWKRHVSGINTTGFHNYYYQQHGGATRAVVEDYLCTDGLPINQSPLYMGDDSIESVFLNRDPRLRQTILHPDDAGPDAQQIHFFSGSSTPFPQFTGQTGAGDWKTYTGYYVTKFYDDDARLAGWSSDYTASIIFKYNEVLLNYAEAKAELGEMTQNDLDISINLLRDRAGMPHVDLSNLIDDPRHDDMGVSDLLVEIRRERRIELMGEGFRYEDVRRWKTWVTESQKAEFGQGILWDDIAKARYPNASVKTSTDPETGKEYIDVYKGTDYETQISEKHYLWPIPVFVLTDNPNLGQNPGW